MFEYVISQLYQIINEKEKYGQNIHNYMATKEGTDAGLKIIAMETKELEMAIEILKARKPKNNKRRYF